MRADELLRAYELKSDDELLHLAEQPEELTPEARNVLLAELFRRRLDGPTFEQLHLKASSQTRPHPSLKDDGSINDFMFAVVRLYRDHFWLFIKLITPAVVIGYVAIMLARYESHEILRGLTPGLGLIRYKTQLLQISLVNQAGYLTSWMAFCVSFGAIASAVNRIDAQINTGTLMCLADVTKMLGTFTRASVLLYIVTFVSVSTSLMVTLLGLESLHIPLTSLSIKLIVYGLGSLVVLVVSRFGLVIPAVVLDRYKVTRALFRSDELTSGKWLCLAALLTKSIVGGYVAGMLPFWIAQWVWSYVHIPTLALQVASVVAVIPIEPVMFIGFSLMYVAGSKSIGEAKKVSPLTATEVVG